MWGCAVIGGKLGGEESRNLREGFGGGREVEV